MTAKDAERQSNEPIRVAIVEDDRAMREGLAMLIHGIPGYTCVGGFPSVEEAVRLIGQQVPEVLLLDIQLPGMQGSEAVRVFQEKFPQLEIVMLTVLAEQDKVFESICNGACGYLLEKTPPGGFRAARLIRDRNEQSAGWRLQ